MSIDIKVLGTGCANCKRLYAEAEKALAQLSAPATLTKVEDIKDIMAYKILATPASGDQRRGEIGRSQSRTPPR